MKLPGIRRVLGRGVPTMGRGLAGGRRWSLLVPGGRVRVASLVLGSVVLVGASTQVGIVWATALPADAVLRVGGVVVTEEEFQQRIEVLEALYGVKQPEGPKRETFNKDVAKSIAVGLILDQAAHERRIVIAEKKARDALNRFISKQIGGGRAAHERFIRGLGTVGTSKETVLDEIKRQLLIARLFNDITEGFSVGKDELKQSFQQRKSQLGKPERRQIYNIVVPTKEDAKEVLQQLRSGTPFEKLARQRSIDGATRKNGGNLGVVRAAQLETDYAKAAFDAQPGRAFGPVQTKHGWNVGKVKKILPPTEASFQQVKKDLKRTLEMEKAIEKWRTWLGEQIKNADVEYADGYRPANPDAPPTRAQGSPPR